MRKIANLLVTGGFGFIGSNFLRYLLEKKSLKQDFSNGEFSFGGLPASKSFENAPLEKKTLKKDFLKTLVNVDLLTYAANRENLKGIDQDPRYKFYQEDILEEEKILEICKKHAIDTIVHFAAETHVDNSIKEPKKFLQTNVLGTLTLLEVVRKLPYIHFHQVSTDEVFGSLGKEGYFTEQSLYLPNSPYSASKASADHFVRAYKKTYGISATLSYCSNNYGPNQHKEKFIPCVLNCLLCKKKIPIYGRGTNIRDWLYVMDHASAIWEILLNGSCFSYAIGGGEEKTNIEMVHLLIALYAQKTGEKMEDLHSLIEFVSDRPGHDFRYGIDFRKLKEELFWTPKYSLLQGLEKTIDLFLQENKMLANESSLL